MLVSFRACDDVFKLVVLYDFAEFKDSASHISLQFKTSYEGVEYGLYLACYNDITDAQGGPVSLTNYVGKITTKITFIQTLMRNTSLVSPKQSRTNHQSIPFLVAV